MNEVSKTGLFVAAAALSLGLAWAFRPVVVRSEGEIAAGKRGVAIFPDLDPDAATSFRLTQFNEAMATLSRIELSKDANTGLWTLPSADGYPADSAEQVSRAITPLVELKVLSTVSTDRGDHALYGVVEPNEEDLTVSASGVGMLVNVGGADNKVLASLIVGKKVEGRDNLHYVRVPTQDAIYEVEISTDGFTTDLEKWIKGEILNVRSFDIEYVGLRDYAIVPTERAYGLGRNFDADLEYKDNKWSLTSFVDHSLEGSPASNQAPAGKKLNEQPLNDLRNNIQNLKIVNVRRKPAGLAADLKADNLLMENKESIANLQSQGFFALETGEVYSAGGELIVGTKEGVRYLLRFGNTRVSSTALEEDAEAKEGEGSSGVNRYLLVTAKLDESKFPAPELKVVPETVEEMLALEAQQAAQTPKESDSAVDSGLTPQADGAKKSEVEGDQTERKETAEPSGESLEEQITQPPADSADSDAVSPRKDSSDATKPDEAVSSQGNTPAESSSEVQPGPASNANRTSNEDHETLVSFTSLVQDEDKPTDAKPGEAGQDAAKNDPQVNGSASSQNAGDPSSETTPAKAETDTQLAPSGKETAEELQERLEFLQETLRKENQRLIDSRNEKLNEARKKVAELNARFAEWYYIVSDTVYNKLKVSRENLFQSIDSTSGTPSGSTDRSQLPDLPEGVQLPNE